MRTRENEGSATMKHLERADDFDTRRAHLRDLSDEDLHAYFWALVEKIVDPLIEEARTHTTPSIERSVLLRMGFSSIEAKALVRSIRAARSARPRRRPAGAGIGAGSRISRYARPAWPCWKAVLGGAAAVKLSPDRKLDIREILDDLDRYRPRRKGWTWRNPVPDQAIGPFVYKDTSEPLKSSVPLPAAHYFGDIDPQCDYVITTEIASGRFEDDLRRMRMAAWHGADHIMVIRTTGQSHFDGLIEGTPEGVGGIPVTRKQLRATRKALDAIEDEVGRPINFHSYVSGLAGPEMAVLFAEEGVNGAHQDPQYNVLYRDINMHRSFVDAAEAKHILADAGILQLDGAHNANATAKQAWKVTPELFVQHAINSAYSRAAGMPADLDRPVDRAAHRAARAQAAARSALCGGPARAVCRATVSAPSRTPATSSPTRARRRSPTCSTP